MNVPHEFLHLPELLGTDSGFLLSVPHGFLHLSELLGTDSGFLMSVPHGFLHLPGLLGTDSRFLMFVLHKLEKSWRTNLRKSSAVPNHSDYSEKSWSANL